MAQNLRNLVILVQPDLTKTLGDPGVIRSNIQISPEALKGLLYGAYIMFLGFDEMDEHIGIYDPEMDAYIGLSEEEFEEGPNMISKFNNAVAGLLDTDRTWTEVFRATFFGETLKPITMRYSAMIESVYPLNRPGGDFWILQFNDLEFLRGIVSVYQWFGLDPYHGGFIEHLHEGDENRVFV